MCKVIILDNNIEIDKFSIDLNIKDAINKILRYNKYRLVEVNYTKNKLIFEK